MLKRNINFKNRVGNSSHNFANRVSALCASLRASTRKIKQTLSSLVSCAERERSRNRIPFGAVISTRARRDTNSYSRIAGWSLAVLAVCGAFSYLTFIPEQASAADDIVDPNEHRSLSQISTMQEMSRQICINSRSGETKRLQDARPDASGRMQNKTYWVAKLADGNCWMTQNLDFDIPSMLDSTTSDVASNTSISATKFIDVANWKADITQIQYYDPGLYVKSNPASLDYCGGSGITSLANDECTKAGWEDVSAKSARTAASSNANNPVNTSNNVIDDLTYDAHYLTGNYYSWSAATAGSGADAGNVEGTQAANSICPKGWKLPTSTDKLGTGTQTNTVIPAGNENSFDVPGSFAYLFRQYGLATAFNAGNVTTQSTATSNPLTDGNTYNIYDAPLYYLRAGQVNFPRIDIAGNSGYYWSSVVDNSSHAFGFNFAHGNIFNPSQLGVHWYGYSVRCVAEGGWLDSYPELLDENQANVAITVSPVISIDVTKDANDMTVDFTKVATSTIIARVGSNQPYQVMLSTDKSNLTNPNTDKTIPMISSDQTIVKGTNSWGIKKLSSPTDTEINESTMYSPVGINGDKALFYESTSAASEDLTFPVAIAVDSSLPSGQYSTQVTLTAVAM